jgi:hypothetical protein
VSALPDLPRAHTFQGDALDWNRIAGELDAYGRAVLSRSSQKKNAERWLGCMLKTAYFAVVW